MRLVYLTFKGKFWIEKKMMTIAGSWFLNNGKCHPTGTHIWGWTDWTVQSLDVSEEHWTHSSPKAEKLTINFTNEQKLQHECVPARSLATSSRDGPFMTLKNKRKTSSVKTLSHIDAIAAAEDQQAFVTECGRTELPNPVGLAAMLDRDERQQ